MTSHDPTVLHQKLFSWWKKEGRVLPWRNKLGEETETDVLTVREDAFTTYFTPSLKRDPYRVVVAELMLQQTQVDRVLPKYEGWMKQWPTIDDLAQAKLAEVLIFWQGLGYNRRARFLWLLAEEIAGKRKGVWPKTEEELLQLPGIGKYTARAVLSFAFGKQVGVVDTNVKRILNRVLLQKEVPSLSEKEYFQLADDILPPTQADPWNQLLMDFGAMICTAKSPKCHLCPLFQECAVNQEAINKGYASYAEYVRVLTVQLKKEKPSQKTIKFIDTDRYFRGRIMDVLRTGKVSLTQLSHQLKEEHGLIDQTRFEKLVTSLQKEGLIQVNTKNLVELG